ncbi:hypothetical protein B0H11DRAFT_2218755 [Mycena galericulata]|nr:hypothetical protein B0H11DRAFT_2218755 [Mycena galericulata]
MQQTVPRASRRRHDIEVVEDSEPEREAKRLAQKQERKRRKLAANIADSNSSIPEKLPVIDISDESVPPSPGNNFAADIIEISDNSTNICDPPISRNKNIVSLHSSVTDTNSNMSTADVPDTNIISLCSDVSVPLASGHSDDEEIVPTLNLARFAFTNSRPLQRRNSSSAAGSTSNSDTQTKPPMKTAARKRFAGDFSDAQLKRISKCVSCDLAWTARKTGEQKLVHIRACVKKTGLTDETVRILIRKELDNLTAEGPSKGKGKALPPPTIPTTLLEDLVRDAAPKRKGKRKETVDALKTVSETRENIADRARMILGPPSEGENHTVYTQVFAAATLTPAHELNPTQAFGPSRLAQRQGNKPSLLGEDSDGEIESPPATQVFAPSKLGGQSITTALGWGYEFESEGESGPVSDAGVPSKQLNNQPHLPPSSASGLSPKFSPRKKRTEIAATISSPAQEAGSDEWSDEAYAHFDPDLNRKTFGESSPAKKLITSETTRGEGKGTKSGKGRIRALAVDADELGDAPPRRVTKAIRSRKKVEDEFDEKWELALKQKIMKDRDLHHRILRYEPINFEIFSQLATEGEPVSGRLKLKLRVFLDKQAINFHGGEAGRTGRR